jgi:4-diphosphocytidyl-2-C-methyl-D-erythritol kinase
VTRAQAEGFDALKARAPAKINLGLFVGALRDDGRHELVSVMQSISLCDELELAPAEGGEDELRCPGVEGDAKANLAVRALAAFRAASGWDRPAARVTIVKRIPVAAGLGGGSADAAAVLRLAAAASGVNDEVLLRSLAGGLGADVPSQVTPGRWFAEGAGERLRPLPACAPLGILVLPSATKLSTAAVYAEFDRRGGARRPASIEPARSALLDALRHGAALPPPELLHNDLQDAAIALEPTITAALDRVRSVGADVALLSGSGPTVLGLFAGAEGLERARHAVVELTLASERGGAEDSAPMPIAAAPVAAAFGAPHHVGGG